MRVAVHNTRADFVVLNERSAQFHLGGAYKFMRRIYPVLCFVLGLLWFWFFFQVYHWATMPAVIVIQGTYVGLGLLASLYTWPILFTFNFFVAKRQMSFGVPYTLELREDGIYIEQANESRSASWSQFRHISYDAHYLCLLNVRSRQNLIIPTHSFSSPDETASFFKETHTLWLQSRSSHAPIATP